MESFNGNLAGFYVNESILREYDIRGIYGENLYTHDAFYIGKAFATMVIRRTGGNKIFVGYDGRNSSPILTQFLAEGIASVGGQVVHLGMVPTPMVYYASYLYKASGAIMVTGSHNPKDFNGFKFILDNEPFYGNDIQKIGDLIKTGNFEILLENKLENSYKNVCDSYIDLLVSTFSSNNVSLKVAWDPGNGATSEVVNRLIEQMPGKHYVINSVVDGNFPAHSPDPTVLSNLEQLINVVKENKCDLGIAFDGDGDRIVAVDDEGNYITGDKLLTLFAKDILNSNPGRTIISDVKASNYIMEHIKSYGGEALMWKTGHSLIKAKMRETGAILAGEVSGHIFFADNYYGYDDAIYAAVRLIELCCRKNIKMSEFFHSFPKTYDTKEVRIDCPDNRKFVVIEEIKHILRKKFIEFNDIDGIRVDTQNSWYLIRASNTQAAIVVRCESDNRDLFEKNLAEITSLLKKCGVQAESLTA